MTEFRLFVQKEVKKYFVKQDRMLASSFKSKPSPVTQLLSPSLPQNKNSIQHTEEEIETLENLAKSAAKIVPCTKGMTALAVAVHNMMRYDPQARRWKERGLEVQQHMCQHMTMFRHMIGRKCSHFLLEIVHKSKQLPKDWIDINNSFWDFYMQDIAERAVNALLEVDWLPEHAKPTLRGLFLTYEQYSKYQDRMLAEAARKERAAKVEWKTGVDTSLSRMGIKALSRSPGIGYFPPAELQTSPVQQRRMRRKSISVMPSRKGMAAIAVAVGMMNAYTPQGGKWRNPHVREIKIKEMRDFLSSQSHKFHIELDSILKARKKLPNDWVDPDLLFWDCHLEEVAGDIATHLMEVDWLPEASKPVLRQAFLSITLYKNHILREVKRDQNRRLADVSSSLKSTMKRVTVINQERTRAQKLDKLMAQRNAQLKKERDAAAAAQLKEDTDVRLMVHQLNEQQLKLSDLETQVEQTIGKKELLIAQDMFRVAIQSSTNAHTKLAQAHKAIKSRNNSTRSEPKMLKRPNTRGSDDRRPSKKSQGTLNPLQNNNPRPSTAPTTKRRSKRREERGTTTTGDGKIDVTKLYVLVSESMKELRKYHRELLRLLSRHQYQRKRQSLKSGEGLREKSKRRVKRRARRRKSKLSRVFSSDIEKIIADKVSGMKKEFHC